MPWFLCALLFFAPYAAQTPEEESAQALSKVRRIYIAVLTGGDAALQIRDLLMSSLHQSKQFIITEEEDKADAVLKGAGDDDVFTDTHQSSDGLDAHSQMGSGSSEGLRNYASSSSNRSGGMSLGQNESSRTEERKHEAIATVRLVAKDGDVIWSATAESMGAKFLGASADVADKIAKRLVTDYKAAKDHVASTNQVRVTPAPASASALTPATPVSTPAQRPPASK
jgi:hypothetical protein